MRYDVPAREVKVGDSVGLAGGSIFWLVVEVVDDRGPLYLRASNQLQGRSHRIRQFTGTVPLVIVREEQA